ncbi:MAG: hypothetical protein Q4D19_04175 [Lautropia sp.]|nr:hypothetical protein [Lautropia sp.]
MLKIVSQVVPVALLLAGAALPSGAEARIRAVEFLLQSDGTPGWDPVDGPGFDSGPNNRIVRTHDSVRYAVAFSTTGPATGVRVRATMPTSPQGAIVARWKDLPGACKQPGSRFESNGLEIDCLLGDISAIGATNLTLEAVVPGTTPNDAIIPSPRVEASSTESGTLTLSSVPPPVRVSAAPFYDFFVQESYPGNPTSHGFSAESGPGPAPGRHDGFYHRPMLGLIARNPNGNGKKGVEQLQGSITATLNLSGYPASVRVANFHPSTGTYADGCGNGLAWNNKPNQLFGDVINLHQRVNDTGPAPSSNSSTVSNGGHCHVQSSSRNHVTVELTNTDTTLARTPTHTTNGDALPANQYWVANKALVLWTDIADYPGTTEVAHPLSLQSFSGTSISGQAMMNLDTTNDGYSVNLRQKSGATAQKLYQADNDNGKLKAPLATVRDPNVSGDDHVNAMAPGQSVMATLRYSNTGTNTHTNVVVCDIIDRTAFDLAPHFSVTPNIARGGDSSTVKVEYGTKAGGPYFASTDSATNVLAYDAPAAPGGSSDYTKADCRDGQGITWHASKAQAEAAGGLMAVRITYPQLKGGLLSYTQIRGLKLRDTWAATINVREPVAGIRRQGEPISAGTILRNRAQVYSDQHPNYRWWSFKDHLGVVAALTTSRITKQVIAPARAAAGSSVPADSTITYRLRASHATQYPPKPATVTITDILPARMSYVPGSSTVGGQAREPDEIRPDTPQTGLTTLVWRFPDTTAHLGNSADAGAQLPPIEFQAYLDISLLNGTVLRNLAHVSAGSHDADPDCQYVPATQNLGNCAKSAETSISIHTEEGFSVRKTVATPLVEAGDRVDYVIRATSMAKDLTAPGIPDHIDILPFNGDGQADGALERGARNPASRFRPGAIRLATVTPPASDHTARVYYTRRKPTEIHNDPHDASNAIPGGSTRWCLENEFGSPGCPASIGESTAFRLSPGLSVMKANQPYQVTVSMQTDALLSRKDDIFANRVGLRPSSAAGARALLYVTSAADVHARIGTNHSSIAGMLYADPNRNLTRDGIDWGIADQCVTLTGTTAKGQAVTHSTRTDKDGKYLFATEQFDSPGGTVFASADCSGTAIAHFPGLLAGTYAVSATAPIDRFAAGQSQAGNAGGNAATDTITDIVLPTEGASASGYDFTRTPLKPRLTLQDRITNDDGGTLQPGATRLAVDADGPQTVTGEAVHLALVPGNSTLQRVEVPAGTLSLGHEHPDGYIGSWACTIDGRPAPLAGQAGNQLVLDWGSEAVCTAHFDDQPASLTLVKKLTINHGRSATERDFTLNATPVDAAGEPVTAGNLQPVSGRTGDADITGKRLLPGRYRLTEDNLRGYTASAWSCSTTKADGSAEIAPLEPGNILSLGLGRAISCTITNTDEPFFIAFTAVQTNEVVENLSTGQRTGSAAAIAQVAKLPPGQIFITRIQNGKESGRVPLPDNGRYLTNDELGHTFLVKDNQYRYATTELSGYTSTAICRDRHGNTLPAEFTLTEDLGGISCEVIRQRKDTVLEQVTKTTDGAKPVAGTGNEYDIEYRITVKNRNDIPGTAEGSSDGYYDLLDTPDFDPNVEIISQRILFDDGSTESALPIAEQGAQWQLASQRPIAAGATHTYAMQFRVRVPFGSDAANDACTGSAGSGLFNQVQLATRNDVSQALLNGNPINSAATAAAGNQQSTAQACSPTPAPVVSSSLAIEKTSTTRSAEVGDLVTYRLRIRNLGNTPALRPMVVDRLPAGFRMEPGSVRVQHGGSNTVTRLDSSRVTLLGNRVLQIQLDDLPAQGNAGASSRTGNAGTSSGEITLSYRARLGVGSQEGDGINRAHVECPVPTNRNARAQCSNESRWKIEVTDGVFSEEACVAGQIYVDCNGNSVKDHEELGIPGVRLYLQNGTWMVSDEQGKYSHCGLRPRTHVLKVDSRTLPRSSRLVTSSAQNVGDAHSLFIDAKKGMLHRADFIEGSCSNFVVEQVKARQQQGANTSVQTETAKPLLTLDSKRGSLPGASGRQQPRTDSGRHEAAHPHWQDILHRQPSPVPLQHQGR